MTTTAMALRSSHRLLVASNQYSRRRCPKEHLLVQTRFPHHLEAAPWSATTRGCFVSRRTVSTSTLVHYAIQEDVDNNNGQLIDYCRSWAWQHLLLNGRLEAKRKSARSSSSIKTAEPDNNDADSSDHILLLEHKPVYTLGRGANEEYITFLQENHNDSEQENKAKRKLRERLSRSNRGPGSARLSIDKRLMEQDLLNQQQQLGSSLSSTTSHHDDDNVIERLSTMANPVLAPNGAPIYRVERGGEVTYHGPSILVVYPMMNLQRPPYKQDLHWFLRMIEEVIIQTLEHYGIHGSYRDNVHTGVWVKDETITAAPDDVKTVVSENKVAAVGVTASRWITTHGFAINVDPDLSWFDTSIILPCGIDGKGVTSIGEILRKKQQQQEQQQGQPNSTAVVVPTTREVASVVVQQMQKVFEIDNVIPGHDLH